MQETIQSGDMLYRNDTLSPDHTDPVFNMIRGATLRVLRVNPGINIVVEVIRNAGKEYPLVGSTMGIPWKYIDRLYFVVAPRS